MRVFNNFELNSANANLESLNLYVRHVTTPLYLLSDIMNHYFGAMVYQDIITSFSLYCRLLITIVYNNVI